MKKGEEERGKSKRKDSKEDICLREMEGGEER